MVHMTIGRCDGFFIVWILALCNQKKVELNLQCGKSSQK